MKRQLNHFYSEKNRPEFDPKKIDPNPAPRREPETKPGNRPNEQEQQRETITTPGREIKEMPNQQ